MAGINGAVFLVIGIIVAAFTRFVQGKADSPGLAWFFWIGIAFIAWGMFKLVKGLIFKDSEKSPQRKVSSDSLLKKFVQNKDLANVNVEKRPAQSILSCPSCGTRHFSTSNYCHMCGTRLKR